MRKTTFGAVVFGAILVFPVAIAGAATAGASSANPWSHARGFLGPFGWYWNNIYYRVFNGNATNMAVFGWILFIAPAVFVGSISIVLKGTKGAFKKPFVPEAIRTMVNG